MNVKRSVLLILIAGIVCLQGCESDQSNVAPTIDQVRNLSGRMVFATMDAAAATMAELTNKPEEDLSAWESKYNFESLRATLDPYDVESDTFQLMYPPQLSSVLNREGEYQVENTIIWFHKNFLFKVPVGNPSLLERIKAAPTNEEFTSYRELFIDRGGVRASENGRIIPSYLAWSTAFAFQELGISHRFVRDFRVLNSGSNYQIELVNCLQYRASNGGWYLKDVSVNSRTISNITINGVAQPNLAASASNVGGYLRLTIYNSSTPFAGNIRAGFTDDLWDSVQNKWISFASRVTWY